MDDDKDVMDSSIEDIERDISSDDIDVVSFDLFESLLVRPGDPGIVLDILSE